MTRSLFVITGMSGAGKTTALKALEDIGCEVIDNLPLSLLSSAVSGASETGVPLAVGIDARTRDFNPKNYSRACREVSLNPNVSLKTVFWIATTINCCVGLRKRGVRIRWLKTKALRKA